MKSVFAFTYPAVAFFALAAACTEATESDISAVETSEDDIAADSAATGRHPRGHHHAPPAEAIAACVQLAQDAACQFELAGTVLTGVCKAPPPRRPPPAHDADDATHTDDSASAALACVPPPPPPPQEVIDACAGLAADAACTLISPRDGATVNGTCTALPSDATVLGCRPIHPPHS